MTRLLLVLGGAALAAHLWHRIGATEHTLREALTELEHRD